MDSRPQIRLGQSWAAAIASPHEAAARLSAGYPDVGEMPIYLRLPPHDRIAWGEAASVAARQLGDRAAEAANLHERGLAHLDAGKVLRTPQAAPRPSCPPSSPPAWRRRIPRLDRTSFEQ